MTRDEAIAKVTAVEKNRSIAQFYVDAQVALGLLKLDEPKGFPQKLRDFIGDSRLVQGDAMERMAGLHKALHEHGLKIVEK